MVFLSAARNATRLICGDFGRRTLRSTVLGTRNDIEKTQEFALGINAMQKRQQDVNLTAAQNESGRGITKRSAPHTFCSTTLSVMDACRNQTDVMSADQAVVSTATITITRDRWT